jgi:hypothetical protein
LLAAPGREGVDRLAGGAWELWEVLDEPRSLAEAVTILSKLHGISTDVLRPHLEDVVKDLLERRWIEEVPAAARTRARPAQSPA